jgi:hypothetical protein
VKTSTRSRRPTQRARRVPQRPRTRQIQRHQNQPLLWPDDKHSGPVFGNRQVRLKTQRRGQITPYGGLSLAHDLAMRLGIDRDINRSIHLLKLHMPYSESDHILTHVYNLYAGGRCIEDIANLQHSQAVKHLVGACRIPDPTTAGDFLRRFWQPDLHAFQRVIDRGRENAWRKLPRRRKTSGTVDMDSTIKEVYGHCKQGADFSYNGKWSYHPLLLSLAETNEPLRTINRPGNVTSADGAAQALHEVLPMVGRHFETVTVRGDSAFYQRAILAACEQHGARFAIVMDGYQVLHDKADALDPSAWKPFSAHRAEDVIRVAAERATRRKRQRVRPRRARERGYTTLKTTRQWVAEFAYTLPRQDKATDFGLGGRTYRVVVKRQEVDVSEGQDYLFTEYRQRFVITNIPRAEMNAAEVVSFAYGRCDQENIIEQFKNGIAAMRMPTGELLANGAFLMAGQLAWCLRSWLSLLALPRQTLRWEWKWFRQAFVYVASKITQTGRRCVVYLSEGHRFIEHLLIASQRLQSYTFR